MWIRYLAASNGDSSGDTSFRLSGRSSSSSSSERSASGKNHPPLTRTTSIASNFMPQFLHTQQPAGRQNCVKQRNISQICMNWVLMLFLRLPKLYSLLPGGVLEAGGVGFLSFSTIYWGDCCTTLLCHPVYRQQLQAGTVYGGNFSEGTTPSPPALKPTVAPPSPNLQRHFLTSWNSP